MSGISVYTTLRLFTGPRDHAQISSHLLGLGIHLSRNYQEIGSLDEAMIGLGKFRKEVPADFLRLGIARSTCKTRTINPRRPRITAPSPTPLRSYLPTYGFKDYDLLGATNHAGSTSTDQGDRGGDPSTSSKRKQQTVNGDINAPEGQLVGPRKKWPRRSDDEDDDEIAGPKPDNPCAELIGQIGLENKPEFLYRKKLVEWDTDKGQNRLLVNRKERLMSFLTEEEKRAVNDADGKPGMEVVAIDSMGRKYDMRCKTWASVGKVVLKTGWHKIVEANGATIGHLVNLWGYRNDDGKFRLAVEFLAQQP